MNHQARGLVDHQDVVVLVDDVERDAFGTVRRLRGIGLRADLDTLSAPDFLLGLRGTRIEADIPVLQPFLQAVARMLWEHLRKRLVQTQPGKRLRNASTRYRGIIS